ncbi:class I SAM-dependent methyltransferase [Rodentibacter caecimuris]|uniref:16S rRNA (Cytosine(1402)-N(4))-methyltransferase n=1 Tax=Rodentibacter caecimuris TaxID=1796644 RepID=A0ABX3KVE3_9PAST|nr:16S rRNA (cytosine(1402)-N(4))-methyltransferase [Rodentibacter heylii]
MMKSVYDIEHFFELYQKLRANPNSLNEIVEKPTMFSLLPELNDKRLLDLGCGTGEHLQYYLQQNAKYVVGIDLSANMLKQARHNLQKYISNQNRFTLHQLSMENLSQIPENDFDVITSSFAFHYVENFSAFLAQITQKLTYGGILIFSQEHPITTCHNQGERWEKNAQKIQIAYRLNYYRDEGLRERNWFGEPFKTYHRTMATILNSLISAGFSIEQVEEPMLADNPQWQQEFKDLQHRPVLLFVKARLLKKM